MILSCTALCIRRHCSLSGASIGTLTAHVDTAADNLQNFCSNYCTSDVEMFWTVHTHTDFTVVQEVELSMDVLCEHKQCLIYGTRKCNLTATS